MLAPTVCMMPLLSLLPSVIATTPVVRVRCADQEFNCKVVRQHMQNQCRCRAQYSPNADTVGY